MFTVWVTTNALQNCILFMYIAYSSPVKGGISSRKIICWENDRHILMDLEIFFG